MNSNVIKAMEAEKEYINARLNGEDYSFVDQLAEFNFASLSEYFEAKQDYIISLCNPIVKACTATDAIHVAHEAIKNRTCGVFPVDISDGKYYAWHGGNDINYSLCNKLGVIVAEMGHRGGTIISGPKDFTCGFVFPSDCLNMDIMCRFICNTINKYVTGATIVGNDIMINNKKVAGISNVANTYGMTAITLQVTFEDHNDLIKDICTKKSDKVVGYIESDILTREVLEEEVMAWLGIQ